MNESQPARATEQYRTGYGAGYKDGFRWGQCQAVTQRSDERQSLEALSEGVDRFRGIKVLYVESGQWAYSPMDDGIASELALLTGAVRTVQPTEDVIGTATEFNPDLVLSLNPVESLRAETIISLGQAGMRRAVWFTDNPYYADVTEKLAVHYDYVITLESSCVEFYRSQGCKRVYHLPFAANRTLYTPMRTDESYRTDVCFIGSAFWNRVAFFKKNDDRRLLVGAA